MLEEGEREGGWEAGREPPHCTGGDTLNKYRESQTDESQTRPSGSH